MNSAAGPAGLRERAMRLQALAATADRAAVGIEDRLGAVELPATVAIVPERLRRLSAAYRGAAEALDAYLNGREAEVPAQDRCITALGAAHPRDGEAALLQRALEQAVSAVRELLARAAGDEVAAERLRTGRASAA